ncbi:MAG: ATP-binding protein [Ilumatobacter sp.]|uniref:ATP-binding protein n=1 Tax=Ilumatobacter sp. TaxID=1967498 RepID=UPI002605CD05|nr:ATP-binding protein [Ilumatobacter sp.]MDJ0770589.1 ATP-binding protein [Ilumatobacter sp.]
MSVAELTATGELRAATLDRLGQVHRRVASAVSAMREEDPATVDPLRGLYITDDHAERIAAGHHSSPPAEDALGPLPDALATWADRVGLDETEVDLLLVAAAPDLDRRYEQLFGYLHDDLTRRRASIGLALRLVGADATDPASRRRFADDSSLRLLGLVELDEVDRPFLTRSLRVPDRVVGALLGDASPAAGTRVETAVPIRNVWVDRLATALRGGVRLVYVGDGRDRSALELSAAAVVEASGEAVVVHVQQTTSAWAVSLADAVREAVVRGCGLVVGGVDEIARAERPTIERLVGLPRPVVLVGRSDWDPEWSSATPLVVDAPMLTHDERDRTWRRALGSGTDVLDAGEATVAFRLGPDRIRRAATAATLRALYRNARVAEDDLRSGARQQNTAGLRRLARRIEPASSWGDLVLEPETMVSLREVAARVRHRDHVLGEWGLRRGGGRGDGITALFAGPSGTGKTLAAEVIAHELGLDLHTVDLATVVDKYIGETEKNLDRIFEEAEQVNTVLFFDEADALFGKRSEVRDARDRYANVEVAYLLQRMERFDGLVVLATNLRLNIDDAFSRRLDVAVDFPKPGAEERRRLWTHLIGHSLPTDDTVEVEFLADSFELTGGTIRNAVVSAAYRAASQGRDVTMADLVTGVAGEYRKLGRLCLESDFGEWFELVAPSS